MSAGNSTSQYAKEEDVEHSGAVDESRRGLMGGGVVEETRVGFGRSPGECECVVGCAVGWEMKGGWVNSKREKVRTTAD